MQKNIFRTIQSGIGFFSSVETKIATLILEDPQTFITYSMTELSKVAEVSQGSIINFAKKFAGGGFPELKLQVAGSLSDYEPRTYEGIDKTDTVKDVLKKRIADTHAALDSIAKLNDAQTLQRVAEKILSAKKVEIYGIYRSAAVADDFYYQLLPLGIPAVSVGDSLSCVISAYTLDETGVVVAVSATGKTKEIIDAIKAAKANGAYVVSITAHVNSPTARLSDDVLVAASGSDTYFGGLTEIRLSQIAITDAICSYLRSRIAEMNESRYLEVRNILNSHSVEED